MAIVKMKKFTLLTLAAHKGSLLKELQKFEDVHFRNLQKDDIQDSELQSIKDSLSHNQSIVSIQAAIDRYEDELGKIKYAIARLDPYAEKPKGLKAMTTPPKTLSYDEFDLFPGKYDHNSVYGSIKEADERAAAIKSEISRLRAEIDGLRPWSKLDVAPSELERSRYVKSVIGTVNKSGADIFRAGVGEAYPAAYVEQLGGIKDDIAMLIMVPAREYDEALTAFKALGFSKLTLGFAGVPSQMIGADNAEISKLQTEQSTVYENIKKLASEYDSLIIAHDYYETALERERAAMNFIKLDSVYMIEGWVPDEEIKAFRDIVMRVCGNEHYLEEAEVPKDSEDVPIKLKNNKMIAAFEDITAMFSMPKYGEVDPTPLLMPFYLVFFGLMVGDAGYGLLTIIGTALALRFLHLKPGMRQFMRFFLFLGFSTVLGGVIYGSFFGFPFFTPIQTVDGTYKAILDTQVDVIPMMLVSVALGVVQVLFGIGVKGYMLIRDGKILSAVFDSLFWIIALLSGIGLILGVSGIIPEAVSSVMPPVFYGSLIALAATQGRENKSIAGKIGGGVYGVYGISSYVGDFVSYTRIAALALSGAYIAFSFNLMAELIPAGIARVLFGTAIFLIGQLLNVGLGLLGAYVHCCRLQYVEYFGKFFEGGGVPFSAFRLKSKYITINHKK